MLLLHGFITSNVPMGVPLEWNVMMVYGGFFLFEEHAAASVLDAGAPVIVLLVVMREFRCSKPVSVQDSVSIGDALLRGQLGLQRLVLPRRQPPAARAAHQERAVVLPAAIPSSTITRPASAWWAR